jgi:sulfur-oxidizing protein SoxY
MLLLRTALLFVALAAPALAEEAGPLRPSATWDEIRGDIVDGEVRDGDALYGIEAPFRAEDAATVPVRITQAAGAPDVRRLILVVDENPAPVAAEFSFGDAMAPLDLELRVRVDAYSNVRAIIEGADGARHMAGRFVRASGGCSAPAAKDAAAALAELGRMKVRWLDDAPDGRRRAQVMLRHPNYSGLQRDQVTQLFVPANFVHELEVRQGGELLFRVEGGISISEDPAFRFAYTGSDAPLEVRARDTDGREFQGTFPAGM